MSPQSDPRRLVVSGGGSGIGRAVCVLARKRGLYVVALDKDASALESLGTEHGIPGVMCDVTDESSVDTAIRAAAAILGGTPDSLVAAAGIYDVLPSVDLSAARFESLLRVNTLGPFICACAVTRGLVNAGLPGAIVLLASIASERGDTHEPAVHYAASKGAIVSMTRQLAVEWAQHGIRVNAVSPGVIRTPMLRLTDDPAAARDYLDRSVPLRRLGEAEEVAQACLYLLGDQASYITGTVLPVDGGGSVT